MNQYLKRALISLLLIISLSMAALFVNQNVLSQAIDSTSYHRLDLNDENAYTNYVSNPYSDATLSLILRNQSLSLYIDDVLSYQNLQDDGIFLVSLRLPNNLEQFKLEVRFDSDDPHFSTTLKPIYLGSRESLVKLRVIQSVPELFLCLFVFCLAILMILLSRRNHFERKDQMSLRYAGIYAILWTIYFLGVSPIVIEGLNPYLLTLINYGVFSILPLPLTLVAYYQLQTTQKVLRFFIRIYGLSLLLATLLLFVRFKSLYTSYYFFLYFQYTLFIIVFIVFTIESFRKNKRAQVSLIALIFLLIGVGVNDYFFVTQETDSILVSYVISYLVAFYLVYVIYIYHLRERSYDDKRALFTLKNKLLAITYDALQSKMMPIHKLRHEVLNHKLSLSLIQQEDDSERYLNYLTKIREDHEKLRALDTSYLEDLCTSALSDFHHDNIRLEFLIDAAYSSNLERLQILHYLTLLMDAYASTYLDQDLHAYLSGTEDSLTLTISSSYKMKTKQREIGTMLKQFKALFSHQMRVSQTDTMTTIAIQF